MPLDEAHEQNNALVKGLGGAVGLTDNPSALLRWMVAGPEVARVVDKFIGLLERKPKSQHLNHNEDTPSTQAQIKTNVKSLMDTMSELGNPFSDVSG